MSRRYVEATAFGLQDLAEICDQPTDVRNLMLARRGHGFEDIGAGPRGVRPDALPWGELQRRRHRQRSRRLLGRHWDRCPPPGRRLPPLRQIGLGFPQFGKAEQADPRSGHRRGSGSSADPGAAFLMNTGVASSGTMAVLTDFLRPRK